MATIDDYTELLIHSDTTNNSTVFTDSSDNARTVTGHVGIAHSTDTAKFGATSIEFDDVNNYLSAPATGSLAFLPGDDFTIDLWVNVKSFADTNYIVVHTNDDDFFFNVFINNQGYPVFWTRSGTTNVTVYTYPMGTPLVVDTWYHLAVVLSGLTATVYVNGEEWGTSDLPNALLTPTITPEFWIGRDFDIEDDMFNGYMDEICVSSTARWTADFTPPTEPYSKPMATGNIEVSAPELSATGTTFPTAVYGNDEDTTLLIHSDNYNNYTVFVDSSDLDRTITPDHEFEEEDETIYAAVHSTSTARFGQSSIKGYAYVESAAFAPTTTVDFWAYTSGGDNLFYAWNENASGMSPEGYNFNISIEPTGYIHLFVGNISVSAIVSDSAVGSYSFNEWHHIAAVMSGDNVKVYLDGTLVIDEDFDYLDTPSSNPTTGGALPIWIGSWGGDETTPASYMDEIRVSSTVRWTSDFIPPECAYTRATTGSIQASSSVVASTGTTFPIVGTSLLEAPLSRPFGIADNPITSVGDIDAPTAKVYGTEPNKGFGLLESPLVEITSKAITPIVVYGDLSAKHPEVFSTGVTGITAWGQMQANPAVIKAYTAPEGVLIVSAPIIESSASTQNVGRSSITSKTSILNGSVLEQNISHGNTITKIVKINSFGQQTNMSIGDLYGPTPILSAVANTANTSDGSFSVKPRISGQCAVDTEYIPIKFNRC